MAATTKLSTNLDRTLYGLAAELRDLPELAAEWDNLSDSQRVTTALDWDHLMASYLTEVEQAYRAGELTDEQRERYRLLRRQLREALPLFEQLNLFRPTVPLED